MILNLKIINFYNIFSNNYLISIKNKTPFSQGVFTLKGFTIHKELLK